MTHRHILPERAPTLFDVEHHQRGQKALIITPELETRMWANYLGSGKFATAYVRKEDVYLYVFHNDCSKSILAQAYREHPSPHLPKIERLGRMTLDGHKVDIYKAKFYYHVMASRLTKENRDIVNILQEAHDEACTKFPNNIVRTNKSEDFNRVITQAKGLPDSIRTTLINLAEISLDWGDHYIFDNFHTRNLGLNGKGKLVFIDPMFDMDKVQKDFDQRRRATHQRNGVGSWV